MSRLIYRGGPAALAISFLFFLLATYDESSSFSNAPLMSPRNTQTFLAASLAVVGCCQSILDLGTVEWTVSNSNSNISVLGKLPSQAHLDLYAAGVIDNPIYGLNDFKLRWVADSNWTYTSVPLTGLQNASSTWLLFNGLDTFSSIEFCGNHVASTNNQFRQYYFDVSDILKSCEGSPVLSINFGSATKIANAIAAEPGQETWPFGVEGLFEFPNRQFIRKEQSDFGWDWGPAFAPSGPWLPAYLIQLGASDAYIRNILVDIYREGQLNLLPPDQSRNWVLNVSIDYIGNLPSDATLMYVLRTSRNATVFTGAFRNVTSDSSTITGSVIIPKDSVDLWWPTGMGPQALYNLRIEVCDSGLNAITAVEKRIGFRTIVSNQGVVTQEQLEMGIAPGNNWHFEINGHEFYAKGSNFIPPDAFWPTVTEARIRWLFEAVTVGNQNMLRVWSSGAYSPDFMYDIADEMGILLWSEFEFGDALYPVNSEFLDNIKDEVYYQVRRINHHPSLAYWAGGNELENLELSTVEKYAPDQLDRLTAEYETLFLDTIVPILFGNSRSISYSPSSTSNGYLELNFSLPVPIIERYNNLTPGSIYGETDHYNYDSSVAFNYSTYPIGRFANEFGYHSMPSIQSWEQAVDTSDLHFNSSTIVLRNHHYPSGGLNTTNYANASKGMGEMTIAVQQWYPTPHKTDPIANFSAWCHATQIFQADFYSSQIQYYRRGSGLRERQLGSLYWQLEDIWQAPTWAGIEYDGRWKVLHYVAKDIYQPVIISPFLNVSTHEFEVWVTSDLWSTVNGTAQLTWYEWSGKRLDIDTLTAAPVAVGAINSTKILKTNTSDILAGFDSADVVLVLEVSVEGRSPNSNVTQTFNHKNWFHAAPLSQAKLVDPGLQLSHSNQTGAFTVKATKGVAAWVWLGHPAGVMGYFDANAFWLIPGEEKKVGFTVKSDTTGGEWVHGVTVESLWDSTLP